MLVKGIDYDLDDGESYNPMNRKYKLLRDFPFMYRTRRHIIPAGFCWDGPTGVPLLWGLNHRWANPALIHDYMYSRRGNLDDMILTRKEADEFFFFNLEMAGVSSIYTGFIRTFLSNTFQHVWEDDGATAMNVIKNIASPLPKILVGAAIIALAWIVF